MIVTEAWPRRKFRSLLIMLYTLLENEGNFDFSTNGEEFFVNALSIHFRARADAGRSLQLFDIGANVGEFSEMLRAKMGREARIHVFEPSEACCARIEERFAGDGSIVLNKVGVSTNEGMKDLYADKDGSPLGSFLKRSASTTGIEVHRVASVPTVRLDAYIERQNISHIDLIKIDTEGHEFEVISSLGRYLDAGFIDFVQFEYGGTSLDAGISLQHFFRQFEAAGFAVAKVMPSGLMVRPYASWMDDFRYANFVAISRRILPTLPVR